MTERLYHALKSFAKLSCLLALAASSAHAQGTITINFETEDDFVTPLVHGQSVYSTPRANNGNPFVPFATDTVLEFGTLFTVSATVIGGDDHLGPAIFDSDPADTTSTSDPDLLVGLGNVLMLQRDEGPNTHLDPVHGLVFNNPSDEGDRADRGSIVFDSLIPLVHPVSLDLVDIDNGANVNVILTDVLGRERLYRVPERWTTQVTDSPTGFHTLSLETLMNQPAAPGATGSDATASQEAGFNDQDVVRLEVQFVGNLPSGALDNLRVSARVIPEPSAGLLTMIAAVGVLAGSRRRRAPILKQ